MRRLIALLCLVAWPGVLWAAFPQVVTNSQSSINTSATTSHNVTLPTSLVNGNLLICMVAVDLANSVGWPGGWTEFFEASVGTGQTIAGAWRAIDGSETSPISVSTSGGTRSAHQCYQLSGAENPATQPPQVPTAATGTSANPNPPALTPTGGAKDYLWFAVAGHEVTATPSCVGTVGSYPANYGNGVHQTSGGGVETEGRLAVARRELNASSEDPGTFTITAPDCSGMEWASTTIAVHPSGAAPATNFFPRRRAP